MSMQTEATIADLHDIEGKAEIVNGAVVAMSPTGIFPSRASSKIWLSLYSYERRVGDGIAIGDNAGFTVNLPHRKSFSPDAAFAQGEPGSMQFHDGAPTFAAEVRSQGDYGPQAEQEIAQKRRDYFAAGTLVVWDVDLLSDDVVRVYRTSAPEQPTLYRRGADAEAEPAVPGWTMAVDDLFV
ncbi:MAG: Uma2 family endonuclease [Herpetosiphonaceae bacterium]|nr:Uma2 family endonuclease [Herpetosiphonaceae bacterium]